LPSQAPKKLDVVEPLARADAQLQKQRTLVVVRAASQQKQQQALVAAPKEQTGAPAVWLQSELAQVEFLPAQQAEQPQASK
jgi:hypothetical protein